MFTVIMTGIGVLVFIISLFISGFNRAFKRMLMFIATGVILDLMTFVLVSMGMKMFL